MRMRRNNKVLYKIIVLMSCILMGLTTVDSVQAGRKKDTSKMDLVDVISKDANLSTLAQAIKAADLTSALKEKGPYTVFAPTNEAFEKLPKETLDSLLKPENKEQLKDILLYHVTEGNVKAEDAKKLVGSQITMLNGKNTSITEKDGSLYINGAKIVTTDIPTRNGTIHVIDAVLIPEK